MNWRKSHGVFKYYNRNPKGLKTASDCAIRAVSTATSQTWEETLMALTFIAITLFDSPSTKRVVEHYLMSKGYQKHKQPRKVDNTKYTVEEFAKMNPQGTYVINVANHITLVSDGYIYDTWNCSHKTVGNYYEEVV